MEIPTQNVREQKNALQKLLNKMFDNDIICEMQFDWMKSPSKPTGVLKKICDKLEPIYQSKSHKTNMVKEELLRLDFVCESQKLIIEYDEKQHFTQARKSTLQNYGDTKTYFDIELWLNTCEEVQSSGNLEERYAFFDAVRDLISAQNGFKLVRIMHGQLDFEAENAEQQLVDYLRNVGLKIYSKQSSKKIKQYIIEGNSTITTPKGALKEITPKGIHEQKFKLQLILNRIFNSDIVNEKVFDWTVRKSNQLDIILKAMQQHCKKRGIPTIKPRSSKPSYDYVCDSQKLIIEYDEKQHFTEPRAITLELYKNVPVNYDIYTYISACELTDAHDNDPLNRDEMRAYYDSVRDILATLNGYKIVRIIHGQMDFCTQDAEMRFVELLKDNGLAIGCNTINDITTNYTIK